MTELTQEQKRIRQILIGYARQGKCIAYSELVKEADLNLDLKKTYHRKLLGQMLGEISKYEHDNDRPMLSSIVASDAISVFSCHQSYVGKWELKSSRNFTDEEIRMVSSAVVVPSQYGGSVKFKMVGGGVTFFPLSQTSTIGVGQSVDITTAKIQTFGKDGEKDIFRIEACSQQEAEAKRKAEEQRRQAGERLVPDNRQ